MNKVILDKIIKNALEEDVLNYDITSEHTIPESDTGRAIVKVKANGIICGLDVAKRVFEIIDPNIKFLKKFNDGDKVKMKYVAVEIEGNTRNLLLGERTALNFMQRMSGIATLTSEFCEIIKGTNARIADTRKTAPGLRLIDKYSVECGGGTNHRYCLSDGVLIKDNHIKAAGGIKNALNSVKGKIPHTIKIEIEVSNIDEAKEALEYGADIIMLDNMGIDEMKEAVKMINGRALVEASGGVSLSTVRSIAEAGVDIISIGALTHSVKAMDISMKII
ncbi:MAG: carboxylating nicotinate-nucleotide diphosphorylase [Deltaproteobacteria bacterium]